MLSQRFHPFVGFYPFIHTKNAALLGYKRTARIVREWVRLNKDGGFVFCKSDTLWKRNT